MISSKSKNINFNLDSQHSVDVIYKYPSLLHYQPSHFVDNAALSFRIKVLRAFPTPGINALDQRHLEQWTSFVMFCQKHQATANDQAQYSTTISQTGLNRGETMYHLASTTQDCTGTSLSAPPQMQNLQRQDSTMVVDVLHKHPKDSLVLCPSPPSTHSGIAKMPYPTQIADPRACAWLDECKANSLRSTPILAWPCAALQLSDNDDVALSTGIVNPAAESFTAMECSSGALAGTALSVSSFAGIDTMAICRPTEEFPYPVLKTNEPLSYETALPHDHDTPNHRNTSSRSSNKSTRLPHKLIERRYRDKMATQLNNLSAKLPALISSFPYTEDAEDLPRCLKGPPKAAIVAAAVKHIDLLERELRETKTFVERLQEQVAGLQKFVKCDECSLLRYFESRKAQDSG
ncbi:hypothetical protein Q7P35_006814 [Cladosporium inversicolor]